MTNRVPDYGMDAGALVAESARRLVIKSKAVIASTRICADLTRDRLWEALQRLDVLKADRD